MVKKWLINLSLGGGILLGLVLLLFLWFRFHTRHGVKVEVPNLKGVSLDKAVELLQLSDLRYEVTDSVYESSLKPNAIVEQIPPAGSGVKPGRVIYLKVNALGKPMVAMPNLVDKSFTLAKALLKSKGLELGDVTMKYYEYSHNQVIKQFYRGDSIAPNTRVEKGAVISLWVTTNKREMSPDSLNVVPNPIDNEEPPL